MDSVDYEEGGGIRFAGTATPGASVRVYVGERHAGDAVADAAGRWMLAPEEQPPVPAGIVLADKRIIQANSVCPAANPNQSLSKAGPAANAVP